MIIAEEKYCNEEFYNLLVKNLLYCPICANNMEFEMNMAASERKTCYINADCMTSACRFGLFIYKNAYVLRYKDIRYEFKMTQQDHIVMSVLSLIERYSGLDLVDEINKTMKTFLVFA